MKNKDWITQLKSKMASHQEEVPDGLWEKIEPSLPARPKSRPTIFTPVYRYAAAAAVLALLGGTVAVWHPWNSEDPALALSTTKQPVEVASPTHEGQEAPSVHPMQTSEPASEVMQEGSRPMSSSSGATTQVDKPMTKAGSRSSATESLTAMVSTPPESVQAPKSESVQAHKSESEPNHEAKAGLKQESETRQNHEEVSGKPEDTQPRQLTPVNERESQILQALESGINSTGKSRGSTFGLYAQNDFATISTRQTTGNYSMANEALFGSDDEWNTMMSPRFSKKTKHHRPYSFGLNFQLPLAKRLSLQTGLVYTYMRSDFITESPDNSVKREQTLHYVGIPVSLMYTLWQAGHFSIYANGGGQADLNVKATMKSNGEKRDIDKDRMQISALFGLGGQYQITPYMGVYVEPSMRYYFDNGSEVENIFKEHPWKFSFHFGFRFNVP